MRCLFLHNRWLVLFILPSVNPLKGKVNSGTQGGTKSGSKCRRPGTQQQGQLRGGLVFEGDPDISPSRGSK